jgi:hypothetical protein
MKKILFIASIAVALIIIFFASCKKVETCATCIEKKTQTTAADYCGSPANVDLYISTLQKSGNSLGQNWECTKH